MLFCEMPVEKVQDAQGAGHFRIRIKNEIIYLPMWYRCGAAHINLVNWEAFDPSYMEWNAHSLVQMGVFCLRK